MWQKKSSSTSNSTPNGETKKTASEHKTFIMSLVVGFGALIVVLFGIYLLWPRTATVTIGGAAFLTRVASTNAERTKGLSGADSLAANQAMLFVFPADGLWKFWMKDMRFNLDIIWLDSNGQVVGYVQNATPATYPEVFTPYRNARYVLEVTAGTISKYHIAAGERASFVLPTLDGGMIKP